MAEKMFFERYSNIYRFMDTINSRPNNGKFGTSSAKLSEDGWSGTRTIEEAVSQFSNGLPEKTETLKKSLDAFKAKSNITATKARPTNYYYGYTPNIPAAIIGLPKSMRRVEKTPQKVKAISILYNMAQNCDVEARTLERSGETVLQLVYALECRGYRVALDCLAFAGEDRDSRSVFIVAINLKDWKQSLDVLKLSFPLTSPAMFRRFGFKWAEGIDGVTSHIWGYSHSMEKRTLEKHLPGIGYDTGKAFCICVEDCKKADFNPLKVAENLGIVL